MLVFILFYVKSRRKILKFGLTALLQIDKDSLHIWPRGSHFMMGLANRDGSFTMTLYMSDKNHQFAFDKFTTPEAVQTLFEEHYADTIPLMPLFKEEFLKNPVGFLGTVFVQPWVFEDKMALIGDAAHAITPFFGQGLLRLYLCSISVSVSIYVPSYTLYHTHTLSLCCCLRRLGPSLHPPPFLRCLALHCGTWMKHLFIFLRMQQRV